MNFMFREEYRVHCTLKKGDLFTISKKGKSFYMGILRDYVLI